MFVLFGLLSGACMVFNRMTNAGLGARIGIEKSTLVNYVTGFSLSLIIWLIAGAALPEAPLIDSPSEWYILLGGPICVGVITISNHVSLKLSALIVTLLVFVSKQAVGLLIDAMNGSFSVGRLAGALLLVAGLILYQSGGKNEKQSCKVEE